MARAAEPSDSKRVVVVEVRRLDAAIGRPAFLADLGVDDVAGLDVVAHQALRAASLADRPPDGPAPGRLGPDFASRRAEALRETGSAESLAALLASRHGHRVLGARCRAEPSGRPADEPLPAPHTSDAAPNITAVRPAGAEPAHAGSGHAAPRTVPAPAVGPPRRRRRNGTAAADTGTMHAVPPRSPRTSFRSRRGPAGDRRTGTSAAG